jgi:uncharacterized protein (DUF885 family)
VKAESVDRGPGVTAESVGAAIRLASDAWEEVRRSPFTQQALGIVPASLPDLSHAEAVRRAAVGKGLLERVAGFDLDPLPLDLALTLRIVEFRARTWAREADWYWTVCDPMGVGFFGLFLPTAYCGGFLLSVVRPMLAGFRFEHQGDFDRYLALAADYPRLIDQMTERTSGQAERGIRIPRPQLGPVAALIDALKAQARSLWMVAPQRLSRLSAAAFTAELDRRIAKAIEPAFDRLAGVFSSDHLAKAPEGVGMSQYPGGRELYAELVRLHTTLDLTVEQVHQMGLERMARIETEMKAIRDEVGFAGDGAAYLAQLQQDPRWRADTAEGVAAVFRRYIERIKPAFPTAFAAGARAGHDVAPLPEALQSSMTFGYYDVPKPDRPQGLYLFNPANLTKTSLFTVGALTYHELVPGHHHHFASQQENQSLHPLRAHSFVNAFNEGWAEYAASLAGELGMYPEPEERYGRLAMDAFLTCRLVVDTGMNALGWSLERARDYMRTKSTMAETEIRSETLRYSCDIPAQSLAYKIGDTLMFALRERMRAALGARFSLPAFHSVVIDAGALPLPVLEWHLEQVTRRLAET